MLCRRFWEVQVEGGLTGAEQLVRQVHVDIWTKTNRCQHLQEAANTFELQGPLTLNAQVLSLVLQGHHLLGFCGQGLEPPQTSFDRKLGLLGGGVSQQVVQVLSEVVGLWRGWRWRDREMMSHVEQRRKRLIKFEVMIDSTHLYLVFRES